jgi:hypothetical protein
MRLEAAAAALSALLTVSACSSPVAKRPEPGPSVQSASLVIDGKVQSLQDDVSCSDHSGGFVIRVGDSPGGIFVVPKAGAEDQVDSVELGNSSGAVLVSHNARVSTTDGKYYVITGDAVPESDKTSANAKPFELKVNCSQ